MKYLSLFLLLILVLGCTQENIDAPYEPQAERNVTFYFPENIILLYRGVQLFPEHEPSAVDSVIIPITNGLYYGMDMLIGENENTGGIGCTSGSSWFENSLTIDHANYVLYTINVFETTIPPGHSWVACHGGGESIYKKKYEYFIPQSLKDSIDYVLDSL